jgi:glycosyltransferase involved in cell wall biosynthesis
MIRIFMIGFSSNKGGVEAYISNLTDNLDTSVFEVIYSMPEMVIDGRTWIRPKNRHDYLKYWKFWKRFYAENQFDVVYFNTCDVVSIDALKFAKAAGIPVRIIHSHNTGNQQGIEQKMSLFHRLSEKKSRKTLSQYATHLFACSEVAGDWMFDGREYQVIKNGIQLSKYIFNQKSREKIRRNYGYGKERIVGIIGRLSSQKNPFFTVKILETLMDTPDMKAVFVGDGEQRTEVEKAVRDIGLDEKVKFTGAVNNVNEWMSAVDCLLMPSLFEGLPFVLVEAQAAGLHCVVSSAVSEEANITGLVEFVDLEESVKTWAERVIDACNRPREDVQKKLIAAGYSIDDTAQKVSEIINKSRGKVEKTE